jgi:hypothetical protein
MDEIYRTEAVQIAEYLQQRYGFPEEMPVVVRKTGDVYHIFMASPIFSVAGDSLIKSCYQKILFSHDTKDDAIKAADQLRDGLAKILSETE